MDFFLNDPLRPHWDNLITSTEVVEHGDFRNREQVVRWVRSFPFAFLTDREYVLARRIFAEGDALYGISKAIGHPDAPTSDIIRVDDYRSMWRSRTSEASRLPSPPLLPLSSSRPPPPPRPSLRLLSLVSEHLITNQGSLHSSSQHKSHTHTAT